jgi:hypothetical protein
VFCYVNSVFAPGLDEGVGNLWRVWMLLTCIARPLADDRYSVSRPETNLLFRTALPKHSVEAM